VQATLIKNSLASASGFTKGPSSFTSREWGFIVRFKLRDAIWNECTVEIPRGGISKVYRSRSPRLREIAIRPRDTPEPSYRSSPLKVTRYGNNSRIRFQQSVLALRFKSGRQYLLVSEMKAVKSGSSDRKIVGMRARRAEESGKSSRLLRRNTK